MQKNKHIVGAFYDPEHSASIFQQQEGDWASQSEVAVTNYLRKHNICNLNFLYCVCTTQICVNTINKELHGKKEEATRTWFFCADELNGQSTLLDKTVYGVENSSTFLECSPKSQRAVTFWQYQHSPDDRKQEVDAQTHPSSKRFDFQIVSLQFEPLLRKAAVCK